jgi:hypothetical protein
LRWGTANRERWTVHVFSQTQILMWIVALLTLEVFHLKWIWLSEWSCGKCARKNLDCDCHGRWLKYL